MTLAQPFKTHYGITNFFPNDGEFRFIEIHVETTHEPNVLLAATDYMEVVDKAVDKYVESRKRYKENPNDYPDRCI